jgi:hypothetical protein
MGLVYMYVLPLEEHTLDHEVPLHGAQKETNEYGRLRDSASCRQSTPREKVSMQKTRQTEDLMRRKDSVGEIGGALACPYHLVDRPAAFEVCYILH